MSAMMPALSPALMGSPEELKAMTQFTLLPAYVDAPGFDAYKTALKARFRFGCLCICRLVVASVRLVCHAQRVRLHAEHVQLAASIHMLQSKSASS
jgi:hypothetical protein